MAVSLHRKELFTVTRHSIAIKMRDFGRWNALPFYKSEHLGSSGTDLTKDSTYAIRDNIGFASYKAFQPEWLFYKRF